MTWVNYVDLRTVLVFDVSGHEGFASRPLTKKYIVQFRLQGEARARKTGFL